jgi:hypothetical protein
MQADNLHPIEAGAELRARLIAEGVMACFAYESGALGATSSQARGPALAEVPERVPHVRKMERREAEIAAVAGVELLRQTAARTVAAVL